MTNRIDGKYYEVASPASSVERVLIAARDRIYRDFVVKTGPSPTSLILDVGVSDVVSDGANFLERSYPHPGNITACGLGEGTDFKAAFPEVAYRQIKPNVMLPFGDQTFCIAVANAVLEHVGSHDKQVAFVRELARVAQCVFITVPNRFFPIEHHTAIPLLQYTDSTFKLACNALGKSSWAREENLILMSRQRLVELTRGLDRDVSIGTTGLKMGPFSSNLYLSLS